MNVLLYYHLAGNPIYKHKVEKIRETVANLERPKKLYPNYLHPKTGKWGQQHTRYTGVHWSTLSIELFCVIHYVR